VHNSLKGDIETSNIPILNLRRQFDACLRLFRTNDFKEQVFNCHNTPVRVPNMMWHGLPHDLLTLLLQRAILGLESYLAAAVEYELTKRGTLSEPTRRALANPFSLSKRAVVALYEKLPALVEGPFRLSDHNKDLYAALDHLYKVTRNPIFHGNHVALSGENFDRVASAFELLAAVYAWIDSWYRYRGATENGPSS